MKKVLLGSVVTLSLVGCVFFFSQNTQAATVDELLDIILNDSPNTTTATGTPASLVEEKEEVVATGSINTPISTTGVDTEFLSALNRMFANGMTKYGTITEFEPDGALTREQAARFFVMMQDNILKTTPATYAGNCTFTDSGFDSSLTSYVEKACKYGIMVGSQGSFRPQSVITKPEFTAALVRMLEGERRDEGTNPRWQNYYLQAKEWELTKVTVSSEYDIPMTRYQASLLLYRSLPVLQKINKPETSTGTTTTGSVISTGDTTSSGTSTDYLVDPNTKETAFVQNPALQEAIYWMYDNGMTKYANIHDYRPFDSLTREEAAKIFTTYSNIVGNKASLSGTVAECEFSDMYTADETLQPYIAKACELGIIKGGDGVFEPTKLLTRPQAVTILMRLLEGKMDETTTPWWTNYYNKAVDLGVIKAMSEATFDKPISRYEVAILLYNSKIRLEILNGLNNNFEADKLIFPLPNVNQNNTGSTTGLININTNLFSTTDTNSYVVDLFGNQYKIKLVASVQYIEGNYVRYGDMVTVDEAKTIGTAMFLINADRNIISGVLRPYGELQGTFYVTPSDTQPYYLLTKRLR